MTADECNVADVAVTTLCNETIIITLSPLFFLVSYWYYRKKHVLVTTTKLLNKETPTWMMSDDVQLIHDVWLERPTYKEAENNYQEHLELLRLCKNTHLTPKERVLQEIQEKTEREFSSKKDEEMHNTLKTLSVKTEAVLHSLDGILKSIEEEKQRQIEVKTRINLPTPRKIFYYAKPKHFELFYPTWAKAGQEFFRVAIKLKSEIKSTVSWHLVTKNTKLDTEELYQVIKEMISEVGVRWIGYKNISSNVMRVCCTLRDDLISVEGVKKKLEGMTSYIESAEVVDHYIFKK